MKYIPWLIVIGLAILCFWQWTSHKSEVNQLVTEAEYDKNQNQHVVITYEKSLSELKNQNKTLYDSIKKLSDVKEAVVFKYEYKYKTDTIHITHEIMGNDSVYHYTQTNDTINYNLDIKGKEVDWFKLGFTVRDDLMIITREKNGQSETIINHGDNSTIIDTDVYIPKKTFKDKFKEHWYVGVGVGAGYGLFTHKPDVFVGVSAGYKF